MLEISIPTRFRKEIDQPRLQKAASIALTACKKSDPWRVAVRLTTDKVIRKLNKTYRNTDEATDVLSFEDEYRDPEDGSLVLGDIMISLEKAKSQAEPAGHSLQEEVEMLLVHGLLHLCGHDHDTASAYKMMSNLQDAILEQIGNPLKNAIHEIENDSP